MVTVLHQQSIIDLAIQETGSADTAFEIALANGRSITDDLAVLETLNVPELEKNLDVKKYYDSRQIKPATALSMEHAAETPLEGIGYWVINNTFIVQ